MADTYKLVVFSRDVNIGIDIGKHSGYGIVKIVDGQPVSMKTIEGVGGFIGSNMDMVTSYRSDIADSNGWIPLNQDLSNSATETYIPQKIFEDGAWHDTTADWVADSEYKTKPIDSDSDPNDAFNKMELFADVANKLTELGLPISYDGSDQNCNTLTKFLSDTYLNGTDIFGILNSDMEHDDWYIGSNNSFPSLGFQSLFGTEGYLSALYDYMKDKAALKALLDILNYLEENNLTVEDIQLNITASVFGYDITINNNGETLVFSSLILQLPPIITLSQLYSTASETTSPLVIDLDGDGVETISTQAGVHFDHDSNGFAENTGWVGKDDGLLVRDINGNGQIDDGTELFGNNSVLSNRQKAANGFEALKELDSNRDGVFNNQDTAWNGVKVWKDSNQNGIVDQDELLTLEQAGISEFDLNYQSQPIKDANGNQHKQTSTITKADGTTSTVTDVWFESDHANTVDKSDVVIPDEIKNLPEVTGFGNVHSLQTAMALDSTGKLKALIEQYAAESNVQARSALLDQIIYHWAGVQDKDPNGRNPTQVYGKVIDDCRKLEALEEFMGKDYLGTWCWGDHDPNPHGRAAPFILQAWDILKEYVNNSLLPQTVYKSTLESITLTYNTQTEKWEADVSTITAAWATAFATDAESTLTMMKEFAAVLKNFGAMALPVLSAIRSYGDIEGNAYQRELLDFGQWEANGTDQNDALYGDDADNYFNGGKGNDNLFGNGGNDLLVGGEGDDYLIGGNGKDIYHFEPGFGNDCIDNMQDESQPNEDIIRFGEGISPDKVTLGRQGFDLIITVSYDPDQEGNTRPNDSIRIYSYFDKQGTTSATISAITFTDETNWDYNYISTHWNSVPDVNGGITNEGNNNDNSLSGTDANDILIGNSGNDYLNGYGGNDLLLGGKGNDHLDGGAGDDTYLYNLGDGLDTISDYANHDKISFGEGISFEDLSFSIVDHNYLKITIKGDESQGIIIQNYNAGLNYKIEDLYFYDGTIVHLSEIPLTYHQNDNDEVLYLSDNGDTVYAQSGNDRITGGMGDDTIIGGKGWDTIEGRDGNNTYIWNLGDGFDTIINDYNSTNTIKFGPGISLSNLTFRMANADLIILVNGDETQGMRIRRKEYLHYLKFADGTTVDLTTTGLTYHQTDEAENSLNYNDTGNTIYGGAGDDTITGGSGNDIISGGKGSDSLSGWEGDDTYIWNLGDGLDTITDYNGTNIIQFGEGITFDDLTFEKSANDMRIYVKGDRTQGFCFNQCQPHTLKFADRTSYQMSEHGLIIHNSDNDDNITGTSLDDTIYGGGGDDTINGLEGNDILAGGRGDDSLIGGTENNTYLWNLGDGFDTITDYNGNDKIKFGPGITFEDLIFTKSPNGGLEIYVKGDTSQGVCLSSQFVNGSHGQIETLEFAEGSTFDLINSNIEFVDYQHLVIDNRRQTEEITEMNGSDGADQMTNSYDYSVTFNGKGGNDIYTSGNAADTYIYNLGDGLDYIYDGSQNNRIKFGPGITYEDLSFRTNNGGNLFIYVDREMTQGLELSTAHTAKYLEFADGRVVDFSAQKFVIHQDNKDENLEINDNRITHLYMGDGNSKVYNRVGHDLTIIGGKGNDEIRGGYGIDTYVWNLGDGMDNLRDTEIKDKIVFGAGITADNLTFRNETNGLRIIVNHDESQGMLLSNYQFYSTNNLKNLYFADGSHLDISQAITLHQTNANDEFCVGHGDNTVYCGAGNDKLEAYTGNNVYIGGTGNDTIVDREGDDTYIYNLGDGFDNISDGGGNDKIVFGEGITRNNLSYEKIDNNLKITINNKDEEGILINNQFYGNNTVETIEFHDGTTLDICNADQLIQAMSTFGVAQGAADNTLSYPTQNVSEMYNLTVNNGITQKAV